MQHAVYKPSFPLSQFVDHLWYVRGDQSTALDGKLAFTLSGHEDGVYAVAIAPDGKSIASAAGDETIRIWDFASHSERHLLRGHQGEIYALEYLPDGSRLVSASYDRTVRLWDTQTGLLCATFRGFPHALYSLAIDPCGERISVGGTEGV